MKTYVIGDIHGGYRGLVECLKRVNFDYENDRLISIGDVCDGWSETHLVIKELKKIKNLVFVMGNHDEWALKGLTSMSGYDSAWTYHGGKATIDSYKSLSVEEQKEFIAFLKSAKPYFIDEKNRLYVHAGYNRQLSIDSIGDDEEYSPEWEVRSTDLWWDRTMWDNLTRGFRTKDPRYSKVFIGHTPTLGQNKSKPINIENVWNVDTGAAFFGPITIMDVETNQFWQSDYVFRLYPTERGRNRVSYDNMLINDWAERLAEMDIHILY
jgi:serine/threonine protein phosphatase 1